MKIWRDVYPIVSPKAEPPGVVIYPGSLDELNRYSLKRGVCFKIISLRWRSLLGEFGFVRVPDEELPLPFDGLVRATISKESNGWSATGIPIKKQRPLWLFPLRIRWWLRNH